VTCQILRVLDTNSRSQVLHLTLALHTVLVLGLAQAASDKVLAASISSTFISVPEAYFWWLVQRLTKGALQWRVQRVRESQGTRDRHYN
jgi:hypothetical protein